MSEATPAALQALAVEIAHAAGRLVLERRAGGAELGALGAAAERKSSATDLATEADRASEALITSMLAAARPDDALVGEEGGSAAGTTGLTWFVDPIDGTTNFVYDYPAWAISIAVADGDGGLAGAVHDPLRGETFSAARGCGALHNATPFRRGAPPPLAEALIGTGFSYSPAMRAAQARMLTTVLPGARDIRRGGSAALDLCSVAIGRLDAFYEANLKPWDSAAGLVIATEAGCRHTVLDDLVADQAILVVAPGALFEEAIALLRRAAAAA
jgi:myo-inositol-1(or 4)-monophosphatase